MNEQIPPSREPPAALPSQETPKAPRWPGVVAWVVIFLAVAFIVVSNSLPELRGRKSSALAGATDVQLDLAGKYAIAAKAAASDSTTQPAALSAELDLILHQVDSLAKTPAQQIRAAIVAGEMNSSDAAVKRLDQIKEPTSEQQQDIDELKSIYASGPEALTDEQRSGLISRYGYFGQVAATHNQPSSDPRRRAVLDQAQRVLALTAILGIAAVIGALLGAALLITAIVLLASAKLRLLYSAQSSAGTVYVEMFALYLVSYIGLSWVVARIYQGAPPLAAYWGITLVLPITIGWAMLRGRRWGEIRQALGWHGGRGWLVEMPLGLVGYFAGLPVIVFGFLITALLVRLSGATPTHAILSEAAEHSPLHLVFLYSIASVWAPLIEETMFRGALFHHMRSRWNWFISAGVVALIFAAIHPQGWTTIPALASIALVLAGIREWRGSILASMTAHGFHNAVLVTMLILIM